MHIRHLLISGVLAASLGGCSTIAGINIPAAIQTATVTIDNPVTLQEVYEAKGSYGIVQAAVLAYARKCSAGTLGVLQSGCWAKVLTLRTANRRVTFAMGQVQNFAATNQTVNLIGAFKALQQAISNYKNLAVANDVKVIAP